MGKKHKPDFNAGRNGRNDSRPSGNAGDSEEFRKSSDRPTNRDGNDFRRGSDFPSRPAFGRPNTGGNTGGGGRFSGGNAGGKFGDRGSRPSGGDFGRGDERGPRGNFAPRRDSDSRPPFKRNNNERPTRSFDRDAPRRFDDRRDSGFGRDRDRADERPAQPYQPKANWPGQPYRQEGKPAVPRGGSGERNRKFNKVNPFEADKPVPAKAPYEPDTRRDSRNDETGPDRPIRPARPFDFKNAPQERDTDRDDQRREGGYERRDRTESSFGGPRRDDDRSKFAPRGEQRREGGFGSRNPDDKRGNFAPRSTGERSSYSDRNKAGGRDFGSSAPRDARPFGERPARPENRPARGASSNRADKPKRDEVPGEAPAYKNLKFYEEDKTRGNKRRREEDDSAGDTLRLNRYIANAGVCSRREADALIAAGEIRVNGEVVTEMGYQVQPTDTVQYGKTNLKREKEVYVLLNKPKDFITTTDDPEGRKTVMDLVATASKERIFPVGRLDRNTTGLLLFTNDGEVAQKLTHPSHKNKKIYQVELNTPLTEDHLRQIAEGVELEDGKAEVDDVAVVAGNAHFVGVELHIGRNRIVRRIFEHLGYEVVSLDRVQYAGLTKKDLPRGKWRYLNEKEVIRLKYFL
ncbi:pseudouridine synthase [Hymenobacter sp. HDW8]|uniref:pseudouridine synthase n=1 Tax=Hymenobacter sp. HDW8 TaxID=2714932 RepID=UPI00140D90FF|nr:pseudouridine synthase [Hymenobacter sp. HDW8]QIL76467.1 pseudouridine synthase [Hymenobacter sp. HDW8]